MFNDNEDYRSANDRRKERRDEIYISEFLRLVKEGFSPSKACDIIAERLGKQGYDLTTRQGVVGMLKRHGIYNEREARDNGH